MSKARRRRETTIVLTIIVAFYSYGALVHILNILSLTGFNWLSAPFKWQLLDVIYLILDMAVAGFLLSRSVIAISAFYFAAISQIILYTVGRTWILDVPAEYIPSSDQVAYLDLLVAFHILTLIIVGIALWWERRT